jgi:uncharacterized protein (TIGR00369 family)
MCDHPKSANPDYPNCFVCGSENPRGLRLSFRNDGGEAVAVVEPDASLEGYDGMVHGGILSALLDEAMVYAGFYSAGSFSVTGELTVRFVKPVAVGGAYTVRGRVTETRGRIVSAESELQDAGGSVLVWAKGKLFRVKP